MTTRQVAYRLKSEGKAELQRDLADVGRAGEASQKTVAGGVEKTNQAMDRQMERWRKMAAAAWEQQNAEERQAAFNRQLGLGPGAPKSAEESAGAFRDLMPANDAGRARKGLTMMQRNTLLFTASDILSSAGSGISPGRMLMQQGPQVLQAFAQDGQMALGTMLKLGLAVGGVATAIGVTAAAGLSYAKAVDEMERASAGLGATSGLSADQLNQLATNAAKTAGVSVGAARDMAASYVSTGRIGGDIMAGLIGITRDYARLTGQDAKAATQELGKAFADPARGADDLNGKLHFLDDTTYRYIQTLITQGKTQEAQGVLMDALGRKVLGAADNFDVLGGAVNRAKNFVVDMFNWYGKLANRMAGGGLSLQDKLTQLQGQRASVANNPAIIDRDRLAQLDREIDAVQKQILAGWRSQGEAGLNQMAEDARAVVAKVNPRATQLRDKEGQRSTLLKGLSELDPAGQTEARAALKTLDGDIAALKAGYASAADQAAKLNAHTREASEAARKAAAEVKRQADDQQRLADIYLQNRVNIAKLRGVSGDFADKGALADAEALARVQALTKQYQQASVGLARARAMAEHQVGEEIRAQSDGLAAQLAQGAEHLTRLQDVLAKGPVVYDENEKGLQALKGTAEDVFDRVTDPNNWTNWRDVGRAAIRDIINDLIKLALINPLKNYLFGGAKGYQDAPTLSGSFIASLFTGGKPVGANANGTDNWRGGLTWVGERGRELVNLPQGAQVFSNARSEAMGGPRELHVHVHAEGAVLTQEVRGWVAAGVREAVGEANGSVPGLVNDHLSRFRIGS